MTNSTPVSGMGGTAWDRHASRAENEDRSRWYGIRPGDTVEMKAFGVTIVGKVDVLHPMDNNGCTIIAKGRGRMKAVCEWCEVIKKVEDK